MPPAGRSPVVRLSIQPRLSAAGLISVPAKPHTAPTLPTVTVVIPNFNYGRYLGAAVTSALSQRDVEVTVVVVDDASTDDSLAVAEGLAIADHRVSVVPHTSNKGAVATFNDGLDHVSGEFLVRLDADDLLTPGSLARAVALAGAYPRVGLVYGHPLHFIETADHGAGRARAWARPYRVPAGTLPPARENPERWLIWQGRSWLAGRCRTGVNVITSPEVLMRTSVVARVGGQRELAHTHDMEMWLRMAAHSDVGYVTGVDQAYHRDHPGSLSKAADPSTILEERRAAFDVLFDGSAGTLPNAHDLRTRAHRALARDALARACHAYDRGRTSSVPIAELEQFATSVSSGSDRTLLWRSLQLRKRLGPRRARYFPPFQAGVLVRRLQAELLASRWERFGV